MQGCIEVVVGKVPTDLLRIPGHFKGLLLLKPACTTIPLLDGGLNQVLIQGELVEDLLLMILLLAHNILPQLLLQLT
jgi:hypothetical protein